MSPNKLSKLENELEAIDRSPFGIKRETLVSLAIRLGRQASHKQGKEPRYLRTDPPVRPPLTIPGHKGKEVKPGTARSVVRQLLEDVDELRAYFSELGTSDEENFDPN